MVSSANAAQKAALDAKEAALEARESSLDAEKAKQDTDDRETVIKKVESVVEKPVTVPLQVNEERRIPVPDRADDLPHEDPLLNNGNKGSPNALANEKLRLQKVYKLFKWTNAAIRKFGHDRLDIILESYRIMGYISRESCDEIKEISRLMPGKPR